MGRELIATSEVFRASLKACAAVLTPLGIDLMAAFEADNGFDEPRTAATGLASLQVRDFTSWEGQTTLSDTCAAYNWISSARQAHHWQAWSSWHWHPM